MLLRLLLILSLCLWWSKPILAADEALLNLLTGEEKATTQVSEDKVIATEVNSQDDAKIQRRLQQIYSQVEGLEGIKVEVSNGIVSLNGQLDSNAASERALRFARQIDGVIAINNRLTVNRTIERRLQNTWQRIGSMAKDSVGALPILLIAGVIVGVFSWLGSWLSKRQKIYRKVSNNY